ncbi:SH3 domain-containing protein, partial [Patescibacteria group bacterium]|nr:SH3 domain-containing protein [Patescibacteria group bacterium]
SFFYPAYVVYVNAKEGLRLRKEASQTADILETMPYGTKLEILEEKSGWIKTTYNSKTGWCMKEYTQASKPAELNIRDVDFKGLIYDYFINEKKLAKEIVNTSFTVATEFGDLTGDKREDALAVATQSGTGVCQTTFVYSYKNGYILNRLLVKDPPTTCHNTVKLVGTDIVEDYAVYNPGDANCCPTGGRKKDYYKWDGDEFTKYKETPYAG